VSALEASVSAGEAGSVVWLSGHADLRSAGKLGEVLTSQVAGDELHLTIEASELSFMDSTAARLLIMTAKVLRERGGTMTIAHPQPAVNKVLEMIGLYELIQLRE
jgi:stage II sporulation protein AA (anti-sigma F factor antagonist)